MASIADSIQRILPNLSLEVLQLVISKLHYLGISEEEDLAFVEENDLIGILKPIQVRKLINAWKNSNVSSKQAVQDTLDVNAAIKTVQGYNSVNDATTMLTADTTKDAFGAAAATMTQGYNVAKSGLGYAINAFNTMPAAEATKDVFGAAAAATSAAVGPAATAVKNTVTPILNNVSNKDGVVSSTFAQGYNAAKSGLDYAVTAFNTKPVADAAKDVLVATSVAIGPAATSVKNTVSPVLNNMFNRAGEMSRAAIAQGYNAAKFGVASVATDGVTTTMKNG